MLLKGKLHARGRLSFVDAELHSTADSTGYAVRDSAADHCFCSFGKQYTNLVIEGVCAMPGSIQSLSLDMYSQNVTSIDTLQASSIDTNVVMFQLGIYAPGTLTIRPSRCLTGHKPSKMFDDNFKIKNWCHAPEEEEEINSRTFPCCLPSPSGFANCSA